MDLYQKNLNFFKENLTSLYNALQSEKSIFTSSVSEIEPLNLKVEYDAKTCYMHSLYNTDRETSAMLSNANQDAETIVVFGMGLWHCYDYLASNYTSLKHIIVIEPDLNLFKSILKFVDIKSLVKKYDISFLVNRKKEDVTEALWNLFRSNISVKTEFVFNLSYRSLYADYYHYIYQEITTIIKNCLINTATVNANVYRWANNVLKNYRHNALPLSKLVGHFTGLPIIIVSAGPSLNHNMQYLKDAKNRAVILAVGSAIKILDSNGIIPHFRMALDPDENEIHIFDNIDTESASLIFSDKLYSGVPDLYKGRKIRMVCDSDFIGKYIYPRVYHEELTIEGGFSVSNVAMNAAVKLGFTKIILIGQDLCYTEGNLYAKGSWIQETINENEEKYIKTINSLGETVYTDRLFLGIKNMFENFIRLNPSKTYINATERGLNISGTVNKSIRKVMEEDLIEEFDINYLINNIINQNQMEDIDWKQKLVQLNLDSQIKELKDLNELRFKNLKKLRKYFERRIGINKLRSELKYIDNKLTYQIQNNEFYKIVAMPSLEVFLYAVNIKNQYNGQDEIKFIENRINCLLSESTVLMQYLDMLRNIISTEDDFWH